MYSATNKKKHFQLYVLRLLIMSIFFYTMPLHFSSQISAITPNINKTNINEYAEFLAGQTKSPEFSRFREEPFYIFHQQRLFRQWQTYDEKIYQPMEKWFGQKIRHLEWPLAFYPFSGPDFPTLYAAYPCAKQYLMIGLEPAGFLRSMNVIDRNAFLSWLTDKEIAQGLLTINHSLDSFLLGSFFHTNEMKSISNQNRYFATILHSQLALLVLMDFEIIDITPFHIDHNGKLHSLAQTQSGYTVESYQANLWEKPNYEGLGTGFRMRVRKKNSTAAQSHQNSCKKFFPVAGGRNIQLSKLPQNIRIIIQNSAVQIPASENIQEIFYMNADLANSRYVNANPGVHIFLQTLPQSATLLKSASFLLHLNNYSLLKEGLLYKSDLIIQDDSGLPINSFDPKWEINIYGNYSRIVPLFTNRFQPELKTLFDEKKPKPLPFLFGYGSEPRMIIAKRLHR